MKYLYVPGDERSSVELLMLHGTGGDESSLVEMGRSLVPGASVLGVKGEVNESGMRKGFLMNLALLRSRRNWRNF